MLEAVSLFCRALTSLNDPSMAHCNNGLGLQPIPNGTDASLSASIVLYSVTRNDAAGLTYSRRCQISHKSPTRSPIRPSQRHFPPETITFQSRQPLERRIFLPVVVGRQLQHAPDSYFARSVVAAFRCLARVKLFTRRFSHPPPQSIAIFGRFLKHLF